MGGVDPAPGDRYFAQLRSVLADVPPAERLAVEASWYRRLARVAKAHFAGTRHELAHQWDVLIYVAVVVLRTGHRQASDALAQHQQGMRASGVAEAAALADSLDRLQADGSTPDAELLDPLSCNAGPI